MKVSAHVGSHGPAAVDDAANFRNTDANPAGKVGRRGEHCTKI
jgi:hypothetical protein